ncbi:50S ribosomal protein L6 [Candidatus Woesearchaeota archaeon]|nr:50S ribosomal protein L6 [Candidatus Woesearchaeota archaeon]
MKKGKITRNIELPDGVQSSVNGRILVIRGTKDEVRREIKQKNVSIQANGSKIMLESGSETKKDKKIIGSLTAHIKNMIRGSMQSHTYVLKVCSGHFPINVSVANKRLVVKNFLGEKIPRELELKNDASIKVEGELIYVTSPSKETAGQVSADIEQLTRRPGYDTRVFQDGIYIINKDGKELK